MSAVLKDVMVYNAPQPLGGGTERHKCTCGSQAQSYAGAGVLDESIDNEAREEGPLGQPEWDTEYEAIANEGSSRHAKGVVVDTTRDSDILGQPVWNWEEIANESRSR